MNYLIVLVSIFVAVSAYNTKSKFMTFPINSTVDERIIDGQPAAVGQFPWQVSVNYYIDESSGVYYICGGVLISDQWVLTAAHCAVEAVSFRLRLGAIQFSGSESGSVTVTTTTSIIHEGYNEYYNNNVALIKLNEPIELTDLIQPIGLPTKGDKIPREKTVRVSGWGLTINGGSISSTLNYADLETISNSNCAGTYGTLYIVTSSLCCVGNPTQTICGGDNGGPLVQIVDGVATLVGISSLSGNGCSSESPSIYVRTESLLDWISSNTGIKVE